MFVVKLVSESKSAKLSFAHFFEGLKELNIVECCLTLHRSCLDAHIIPLIKPF